MAPTAIKKRSSLTKEIGFFLGIIVFMIVWIVGLPGLSTQGNHATAIAFLTAIWWISLCMPPMIPALCACVLFLVTDTAPAAEAFSGFISPTIWLLFFALVMAKGVNISGLGKRIATAVLARMPLSFNGLVISVICLCLVFPFIIPSAAADVALIMTFLIGVFDALGIEKSAKNKISTGLTCFVAILTLTFGRVPLTGSLANFLAVGLVNDLAGVSISWLNWLSTMWVMAPIPAVATYFYITKKYKPDTVLSSETIKKQIGETQKSMGPMTANEKKAAIFVLMAVLLWITDSWHPLSTSQVGLITGMLFLLPYVGFLTIKDFSKISLVTFFFAGGSYSIGKVLTTTGFATWAGEGLLNFSFLHNVSFFIVGLFVILFAFVLHFFLETMGEISLLTPIFLEMGILPAKAVAMLTTYGAGLYIFPFQSTVMVLSLGFDTTNWSDIMKYGIFLTIIGLAQGVLFLGTYWIWMMV